MQGLAGNLQLPWLTGSSLSQAPQSCPFHPLTSLACPQCPTGRRETAGIKYEACSTLCTIHALSQNKMIFAAVYKVSCYPPFTDGEISSSELCDLPRARELEDSNPDLSNRKAWVLTPHASQTPARGLPGTCQPTIPNGPEHGRQATPLFPFHCLLGVGCPLACSLGSVPGAASLPCGPAPGSWP